MGSWWLKVPFIFWRILNRLPRGVLFAVAAGQNPCKLTDIPYKKLRQGASAWGHKAPRLSTLNIKCLA